MGRQPIRNPVSQVNMRISEESRDFILFHRRPSEPYYMALDRIIHSYRETREEKDILIEQLKKTIAAMQRDLLIKNSSLEVYV